MPQSPPPASFDEVFDAIRLRGYAPHALYPGAPSSHREPLYEYVRTEQFTNFLVGTLGCYQTNLLFYERDEEGRLSFFADCVPEGIAIPMFDLPSREHGGSNDSALVFRASPIPTEEVEHRRKLQIQHLNSPHAPSTSLKIIRMFLSDHVQRRRDEEELEWVLIDHHELARDTFAWRLWSGATRRGLMTVGEAVDWLKGPDGVSAIAAASQEIKSRTGLDYPTSAMSQEQVAAEVFRTFQQEDGSLELKEAYQQYLANLRFSPEIELNVFRSRNICFFPLSIDPMARPTSLRDAQHAAFVLANFYDVDVLKKYAKQVKTLFTLLAQPDIFKFVFKNLERSHERHLASERDAAVGRAARDLAHSLRQPLGAIANVRLFLSTKLSGTTDVRVDDGLALMSRALARADKIIKDILYSAALPGDSPQTSCAVRDLIEAAVAAAWQTQAPERVTLQNDVPADIMIIGDPTRLVHALQNIIENAVQALDEVGEGSIEITGVDDGETVKLSITDNGPGMKQDVLARVFEPYFTTKAQGTGLGLRSCLEIMRAHGGLVSVASESGHGTTVSILLPKRRG